MIFDPPGTETSAFSTDFVLNYVPLLCLTQFISTFSFYSPKALSSVCPNEALDACSLGPSGDPENPMCARLTLTGKLVALDDDSEEHEFAKKAFFERHPAMANWPQGHGWVIAKIVIQDIWLIDFFGGATVLDPKDYFAASFSGDDTIE